MAPTAGMRDRSLVQQEIERQRARWVKQYPSTWLEMIGEWNKAEDTDRAWLMYSANYLLRTGGTRWAIDPLVMSTRIPGVPEVDIAGGLGSLSFILLTHRHEDHLDLNVVRALRHALIRWVVPDFLYDSVVGEAGIPAEKVIVPRMLEPIRIDGVTITAFAGLHLSDAALEPDGISHGVPAAGYLAEFQNKRWLFPGDVRSYDPSKIPAFGPVDIAFAHLWLGRSGALLDHPPLLDAFCDFYLKLNPSRLVITHLYELEREPDCIWGQCHFEMVSARLHQIVPDLPVSVCTMGESIEG
jgi:hypothetical protein